jgi:23S rRNA pseudouridine1911/1915/1917 synthase
VSFRVEVTEALAGKRLDRALAEIRSDLSRVQIRRLIESGAITVCSRRAKVAHRLRTGERVEGSVPAPVPLDLAPEAIPLAIAYEDAHLLVIDKPAGLVVHPAAGHQRGTLVHALLHHCRDLAGIGGALRPGIVHRLDKDTSGLLVVAKSDAAHRALTQQFRERSVDREYLALVRGSPGAETGTVDAEIRRHPSDRKRFTADPRVRQGEARRAVTHWSVARRLGEFALLRVRLETGRTHQIRVHLASVGLPVAGDPVYGGGRRPASRLGLRRQALHAARLGFAHPKSGERLSFESPLPDDLRRALEELER